MEALREQVKDVKKVCQQKVLRHFSRDHPRANELINQFVSKATELCWHLILLPTKVSVVDPTGQKFSADCHERHALSELNTEHVQRCMWPALVLDDDPRTCLVKAIVITT